MAAPHYGGPSGPCYGGPSLWHPLVMVAPRALAMVAPRYGGPSLWRPLRPLLWWAVTDITTVHAHWATVDWPQCSVTLVIIPKAKVQSKAKVLPEPQGPIGQR